MSEATYLTTRELAELLRIKERKVYDLAANGSVPHTKAMGKLLFPRAEVEAWLKSHSSGLRAGAGNGRRNIALGSHDPMLDWTLRASNCGIAALFDGSLNGLERFAAGEGIMTGLHIHDAASGDWNIPAVGARFGAEPMVLVEWCRRQRGLIAQPDSVGEISAFGDIAGKRVVMRQEGTGSQALFREMLGRSGLGDGDYRPCDVAGTESEAALGVLEGKADVAFGLESVAAQYRLAFVPIIEERFDLLVDRKAWFDPPMQAFLDFCRSPGFAARTAELKGYDFSRLGAVRFNGA